jgi:Glycosyl transferase family 11
MSDLNCIIQIYGGLGNQMFQYALGRRLITGFSARVRYDLGMYRVKTDRELTLRKFRTSVPETSAMDVATMRLSFGRTMRRLAFPLKMFGGGLLWNIFEDPRKGVEPKVFDLHGRWYLRGYWQCPEYFETLRPLLWEEFQPRDPLSRADAELLGEISNVNAVCLHVRRGDYVSHPVYSKQLRVQSADYFNTCLAEMIDRLDQPHIFVFSDDPDWVRQNIRGDAPIRFMEKKDAENDFVDLHLMSQCRHFITSNSTFSWWAAWLSTHPQKIVIAPPQWGYDGAGPPAGLIPADWQLGPSAQLSVAEAGTVQ